MPDWDSFIDNVAGTFSTNVKSSSSITMAMRKLNNGTATFIDANTYGIKVGNELAKALHSALGGVDETSIPEEVLQKLLSRVLGSDYAMVSSYSTNVQKFINTALGIDVAPQKAAINQDRITGMAKHLSELDTDHISDVIDNEVVNFSQSVVDDTMKENAEFLGDSGVYVGLQRIAEPGACEWCLEREGEYSLDEINSDVFARHVGCECQVVPMYSNGKTGSAMRTSGKAFVRG